MKIEYIERGACDNCKRGVKAVPLATLNKICVGSQSIRLCGTCLCEFVKLFPFPAGDKILEEKYQGPGWEG